MNNLISLLLLIILIPIFGAIYVIPIQEETSITKIKQITLSISIIPFLLSILCFIQFNNNCLDYQFTFINKNEFTPFTLGIDGLSLYFVILTTFIIPICLLSNYYNISINNKNFVICFLILESLLITTFLVLDIILFYVFFESVLIPLFLIVGIWGGSNIRVRAAYLLFLYTLFGSLFILLAFITIYNNVGITDFQLIQITEIDFVSQKILFFCTFISIAIKTPLFPFNTWLTYAHSEAPVGGSIVLAGVILKLSVYGFLRIVIDFFTDSSYHYIPVLSLLCVLSIIYASLTTLRQIDFKKLIAYSSVAHIGVCILGVFSNTIQGIEGSILLSIAHGFVSPALFFILGQILYDRYHTRIIQYYRGLNTQIPVFGIFFFIFTICNAAVPLSANWLGELLSLLGAFKQNIFITILSSLSIVLSACYSIFLFNRINFGDIIGYQVSKPDINRQEFIIVIPLLIITFIYGIFPTIILEQLHITTSNFLYS